MNTRQADYSSMTDEEFDAILLEIVQDLPTSVILSYDEVNAFFREELNNEILAKWEQRNPGRAFPKRPKAKLGSGHGQRKSAG